MSRTSTAQVQSVAPSSIMPASSRRRRRPSMGEIRVHAPREESTALALELAVIRTLHQLDTVAIADGSGQLLCVAGDADQTEWLAAQAREVAETHRASAAQVLWSLVDRGQERFILLASPLDACLEVGEVLAALANCLPARKHEVDDDSFELQEALSDAFLRIA